MDRAINWNENGNICFIGSEGQAGTYILRLNLMKTMKIPFGRFDGGREIELLSGEYLYIGSALAKKGSTTLGNRIQRHCARSDPMTNHKIRSEFRQFCTQHNIHTTDNPSNKTPFWNIDHLTNLLEAEIIGIIAIRDLVPLENPWSEYIEAQPFSTVFAKGLGANDAEGHTHLQYCTISEREFSKLPEKLPLT